MTFFSETPQVNVPSRSAAADTPGESLNPVLGAQGASARPVAFPDHAYAELFPFHLVLDSELRVVQRGGSLARACPQIAPGDVLSAHFCIERPDAYAVAPEDTRAEFASLRDNKQLLILLRCRHNPLLLRGQSVYDVHADRVFFLGSPQVTSLEAITALGLGLSDFALHDLTPDLLFLIQSQATALAEFRALSERLTAQKRQLRLAQTDLEARVQTRTEELMQANARLQTEVAERERVEIELRRAKEAAEANSRAKSLFVANISHELRTPLNAIIGFSEILAEQAAGELNPRQARYISNVLESGRHLLQIINNVLDLTKAEAGRMQLACETFDPRAALDGVLDVARGLACHKNITLGCHTDVSLPPLYADPPKFKQILYNLLSNAIKFTPDGGRVEVYATVQAGHDSAAFLSDFPAPDEPLLNPSIEDLRLPGGGAFLRVTVCDTGIGLALEDQQRIFAEFEQVDNSHTRRQQGTGLGLALTRRIVELHGGRIRAQSEGVGRGSAFEFVLPVRAATAEANSAAHIEAKAA